MMPSVSGSICRPAWVGVAPLTICRYSGSDIIAPNIPAPCTTVTSVAIRNTGRLNRRSGSSAASPIRRSCQMKATTPSPPMTYIAIDAAEPQPHSRPCSATISSGTSPTASVTAPQ